MPEIVPEIQPDSGANASEISEQDVARVRESMSQAKQVRDQIKSAQHQNAQFAKLLGILLLYIDDDVLLASILRQVVEYKFSPVVIFAQFLPLLQKKMDIAPFQSVYGGVRNEVLAYEATSAGVEQWFTTVIAFFPDLATVQQDDRETLITRWKEIEGVVGEIVNPE